MSRSRADVVALAALSLVVLLLYVPLGDGILWGADFFTMHQFRASWARECFAHGEWPVWYPRGAFGGPFFANVQHLPLLPHRLIALLAPIESVYGVSVALSALLAAWATYALARQLAQSPAAAAVSGFTFVAGSFFAARVWAGHMPILEAAYGLPLLLALVERLVARGPSRGRLAALALAALSVVLAGHPQIPAYTIVATTIHLSVRARGRTRWLGLAALALGVLASLFQWLPALAFIGRSARILPLGTNEAADVRLGLSRALALLVPGKDGIPLRGAAPFEDFASRFWDTTAYVGLLPWIALPFVRSRAHLSVLALGALALVGATIPSSFGGVTLLHSPARLLYVTALALSVGSGALLDALHSARVPVAEKKPLLLVALAVTVGGLFLARSIDAPWGKAGVVLLTLLVDVAAIRMTAGRERLLVLALLGVAHAGDVLDFSARFVETRTRDWFDASPELARKIAAAGEGTRVAILTDATAVQNLARSFDTAGGFDPLFLARTYRAFYAIAEKPLAEDEWLPDAWLPLPALRQLGVRFVVAEEPGTKELVLHEVPGAVARWSYVPRSAARSAASPEEALAASAPALRSGEPALVIEAPLPQGPAGPGEVHLLRRTPSSVRLRCTSAGGFVRIAEAFDPGWRATLDGQPVPVLCADAFLQAVELPPGEHEVDLVYETPRLGAGIVASLGVLALGLALMVAASPGRLVPSGVKHG